MQPSTIRIAIAGGGLALFALLAACSSKSNDVTPSSDAGNDGGTPEAATEGGQDAQPEATVPEAGILGGQNDRAGRAAIAHGFIDGVHRDAWNQLDTFTTGSIFFSAKTIKAQFQLHLVNWDMADGTYDWHGGAADGTSTTTLPDGGVVPLLHPLLPVFSSDVLTVDTTKPFSETSYLDIEYATVVSGAPGTHTTCGGRWMNEDAVDKTLSFIVKKSLTGVSDNVNAPAKPATLAFPYLVAP